MLRRLFARGVEATLESLQGKLTENPEVLRDMRAINARCHASGCDCMGKRERDLSSFFLVQVPAHLTACKQKWCKAIYATKERHRHKQNWLCHFIHVFKVPRLRYIDSIPYNML
eukprot:623869-Amphidinium_carterae.2